MTKEKKNIITVALFLGLLALFVVCFIFISEHLLPSKEKTPDDELENVQQEEPPIEIPETEPEEAVEEPPEEPIEGTQQIELVCTVLDSLGNVDEKTFTVSAEIPAEWVQTQTGDPSFYQFEHRDGSKAADGFTIYKLRANQTIWAAAKVHLDPNCISFKAIPFRGNDILVSIDDIPAENEGVPDEQKTYAYSYHLPYQGHYILIQFYEVGQDHEAAIEAHQKIWESVTVK